MVAAASRQPDRSKYLGGEKTDAWLTQSLKTRSSAEAQLSLEAPASL